MASIQGAATASFQAPPLHPVLFDIEDVEDWNLSLKSEGYAVIHNFLSPEIREHLLHLFYQNFFEASKACDFSHLLNKMDRSEKETWVCPNQLGRKSRHAPLHIAQSDFMWELRTQPNIHKVFSHIYNVKPNELCISLDSYSLHLKGHPMEGLCLHDDQAYGIDQRSNLYSIQGSYNFYSCNKEDTGLMIVPGSHSKWYKRRAGEIGSRHERHFVPISSNESDYSKSYLNAKKLILPNNCYVIWNSKLLHGTCIGTRERSPCQKTNLPKVNRLTCFLAMLPKTLRSQEVFNNKCKIYRSGGSTSHWASHAEAHELNQTGPIQGTVDEDGNIPVERLNLL